MTAPPHKRQKRSDYRKAAAAASQAPSSTPTEEIKMPQKRFYRQRAHANPFSDHQLDYPLSPAHMNWATHFPAFVDPDPEKVNLGGNRQLTKDVEVVDIGCGFGGLLIALAPVLPETLMVGMEIRIQALEYVIHRINALRKHQDKLKLQKASSSSSSPQPQESSSAAAAAAAEKEEPHYDPERDFGETHLVTGNYANISAHRANTMKFLPNFFAKGQLSKIFIAFPDPHFKARKHKARIVSEMLNAEYAYVLRAGGLLYTITDVEEYHRWILRHFGEEEGQEAAEGAEVGGVRELFERVGEEELSRDECVRVMMEGTEEGKKVSRNKGNKYVAVFRRKEDPEWL